MTQSVVARLAALKIGPHARPEGPVARTVRHRAATLQPALPGEPAGLPHPGTGLWRAEARDRGAAAMPWPRSWMAGTRSAAGSAAKNRPIAGTRLIREWQGVEHCVTVRDDDFEYQGRPYKSLSAVARVITGTRWNGWCSSASRAARGIGMP